jgi:hypothetical protein
MQEIWGQARTGNASFVREINKGDAEAMHMTASRDYKKRCIDTQCAIGQWLGCFAFHRSLSWASESDRSGAMELERGRAL